ncbi:MAG: flavodoxin family protein [Bacilli bacterium]
MHNNIIFNGSPRRDGTSKNIINYLEKGLKGKTIIFNAYELKISPCIDCRYCWYKKGCSINDEMNLVYEALKNVDNIIFVSPVYFNSVSSPLKCLIDRLQTYWATRKRNDQETILNRKGAYFLCGGAPLYPKQFLGSQLVLDCALLDLQAKYSGFESFSSSDDVAISTDKAFYQRVDQILCLLNE